MQPYHVCLFAAGKPSMLPPCPASPAPPQFDNCFIRQQDWVVDQYARMRDALNATGKLAF